MYKYSLPNIDQTSFLPEQCTFLTDTDMDMDTDTYTRHRYVHRQSPKHIYPKYCIYYSTHSEVTNIQNYQIIHTCAYTYKYA